MSTIDCPAYYLASNSTTKEVVISVCGNDIIDTTDLTDVTDITDTIITSRVEGYGSFELASVSVSVRDQRIAKTYS